MLLNTTTCEFFERVWKRSRFNSTSDWVIHSSSFYPLSEGGILREENEDRDSWETGWLKSEGMVLSCSLFINIHSLKPELFAAVIATLYDTFMKQRLIQSWTAERKVERERSHKRRGKGWVWKECGLGWKVVRSTRKLSERGNESSHPIFYMYFTIAFQYW